MVLGIDAEGKCPALNLDRQLFNPMKRTSARRCLRLEGFREVRCRAALRGRGDLFRRT
jgi:hypothetical protein